MKWPSSQLYVSVSFVLKLYTSCFLIDWIIGPDSKIRAKPIVDDCVISPKYSMPEMIYLYVHTLFGRKGVLNVKGVDVAGIN